MKLNPLIEKAIFIAGSQSELARRCGEPIKQQHVWKWLRMKKIPAERALSIEKATNGQVTKHQLRPDLWPEEKNEDRP